MSAESTKIRIVKEYLSFCFHRMRKINKKKDVLDVYLDKSMRVFIIDFNPFYEVTDALWFSWNEICELCEKVQTTPIKERRIDMRVCESKEKRVSFKSDSQYRYPVDAVDVTNAEKISEFIASASQNE